MVTHIVMWNLNGDIRESAAIVRDQFESMPAQIPQIEDLTVAINTPSEYSNRDLALITRHRSTRELFEYQVHPYHEHIKTIVSPHLRDRACVDFEGLPGDDGGALDDLPSH